ncbi:MAG TPA: hypothetical protein VEM35_09945, partial [Rhizomicrobium sp.]|nr:hypothetical protein [Rhizomicrobium sp.]
MLHLRRLIAVDEPAAETTPGAIHHKLLRQEDQRLIAMENHGLLFSDQPCPRPENFVGALLADGIEDGKYGETAAPFFAASHNNARDNLATMSLYTKLAVRLFGTYGRDKTGQGISKKMRSITRRMMLAGSSAAALLGHLPAWAQAPRETDWTHYANDLASTRYSPLDQINAANFNQLELAWRFSTNSLGPRLDADYQSTPLVVKGRIYSTAGFRRDVVCLDAGSGELLWIHTHDEGERIGSRGGPGLGVGYWTDGSNERILYVTRGYTMFS